LYDHTHALFVKITQGLNESFLLRLRDIQVQNAGKLSGQMRHATLQPITSVVRYDLG
jgi:hypothetical protein